MKKKTIGVILSLALTLSMAFPVYAASAPSCWNCKSTTNWEMGMGATCSESGCTASVGYYVCPNCNASELYCEAGHLTPLK